MKRMIVLFTVIFILGGCGLLNKDKSVSEMDPKDLPNVPAFQDEFTREFMGSTKEVEDGFYSFLSKTGGYTMMYPENAKLSPVFYDRTDEYFEFIEYSGSQEPVTDSGYFVRATYMNEKNPASLTTLLNMLSESVSYEGEYKELSSEDKTIHYNSMVFSPEQVEGMNYNVFGVIKSNSTNESVSMVYSVDCNAGENDCELDEEKLEDHVLKVMESIEFKNNK